MDGWMNGWNCWMNGWVDGQMDGIVCGLLVMSVQGAHNDRLFQEHTFVAILFVPFWQLLWALVIATGERKKPEQGTLLLLLLLLLLLFSLSTLVFVSWELGLYAKKLELDLEVCKIGKSTFFCSLKLVSGGTVIQPTNPHPPPPPCLFLCCFVKRPSLGNGGCCGRVCWEASGNVLWD